MSHHLTKSLLLGTAATLLASAALAQTAPTQAETVAADDATELEAVVVTGSRIARPEIEAAVPVAVVRADDLKLSGQTQADDVIRYIPALSLSLSSDLTATQVGSAENPSVFGGTTLNLRGLGSARTLVLVDGRRHVAGAAGSAAVDVNSIPSLLIERVEALTGGASAIYGSDAVTGVVNYVLKQDFEGVMVDAQIGLSEKGDTANYFTSALIGQNFAGGRGNITLAFEYSKSNSLRYKDRDFLRNRLDDDANPVRRIQAADLAANPALAAAGVRLGASIAGLTDARKALLPPARLAEALSARPRAFLPNRTFSISSPYGVIGFDPFATSNIQDGFYENSRVLNTDFDGNGVQDCLQTYNGAPGGTGFGCWVVDPVTGRMRPFQDGLIAGFANMFGGDGIPVFLDNENVIPNIDKYVTQMNLRYEVTEAFKPFAELKFVRTAARDVNNVNSFNDTIPIRLDNPFIPAELRSAINAYYAANPGEDPSDGRVIISRDNTDFGVNDRRVEREVLRFVAGVEGNFLDNFSYELSFNYGRSAETETVSFARLEDRFYAAVDAVTDPVTGRPTCRINVNPNAVPETSPFPAYQWNIDPVTGRIIPDTFGLTDGSCRPLSLFGLGSPSEDAVNFVNVPDITRTKLEQIVISGIVSGDSSRWFELPGGPVRTVVGAEYRKEKSRFEPSEFQREGYFFESGTQPTTGRFNVKEVFGEVQLPLIKDVFLIRNLSVEGAVRYSDYNTVGTTTTWTATGTYSPVDDLKLRGSYAKVVRAPNISDLFDPVSPATFRPNDPCDAALINSGPNPANRLANCRADGIPVGFTDPLTARITGASGGNPNLQEETAKTWTMGVVLQPRFVPGLVVTLDYYSIKISDAIAAVSAQEIVDACYDSADFPNSFCGQFTRNRTPGPTFLGFNYLLQSSVNFAQLRTRGLDFGVRYGFDLDDIGLANAGSLVASVNGTYVRNLDRQESATRPDQINPELKEIQRPKYAFNTSLTWKKDGFTVNWSSFWQSSQFLQSVEIENEANFALPNRTGTAWIHDLSMSYEYSEQLTVRAGVNNLTNRKPFAAEAAYPVSPAGRSYFIGATAKF